MNWVEHFVIRHELCPFAAHPFGQGRVVAVEVHESSEEAIFYAALAQVQALLNEQSEVETTLLVFPNALGCFDTFLDFVFTFEQALVHAEAHELVQLAHFHPHYRFAGVPNHDPGNLTNRAPFPVVQLLRVDSVAKALEHYPEAELIPDRNIALLRKLVKEGKLAKDRLT